MSVFLARRLVIFAISLFAASLLVFVVLSVLPGDPAQAMLGTQASPRSLHELRHQLGLDRPLWERYSDWATGLLHADLGTSAVSQLPAAPVIGDELEVTGPLVLLGLVLALVIALPAGVLAALRQRRLSGTAISAVSQIGIAIPEFWAGILLITIVSVHLGWLPAGSFPGWGDTVTGSLEALVLPSITLALVEAALLTRFVRAAVLDVLRDDFIRTARATGQTRLGALRRHGLRNAAIPIVTVIGLQVAGLLAGAVVIENVFTLPGLGTGLLDAIRNRDTLLVQDIVMLLTATVLVVNLIVDLSYRVLDPPVAPMSDLLLAGDLRSRRRANGSLVVGVVLVGIVVLAALVSLVWTPYDPTLVTPDAALAGSSLHHPLGADQFGVDILSQLMTGAQTTLLVGVVAIAIAALVGIPVGAVAAQRGGAVDELAMRASDVVYAFPAVLVAIMLAAAYGGSTVTAMVAIGIAYIPVFARLTRASALGVLRSDYVLAARAYGRRPGAILLRHVLPNIAPVLIVQATVLFAVAILAEAALSYLGLGTAPPTPSWGRMLSDSQTYVGTDSELALWPGLAIALTVLGFGLLGDGLRDVLDPRLRR